MSVRFSLLLLLGIIMTAAMGLGCGAAPASQTTDGASAPQPSVSAPTVKATESGTTPQTRASAPATKAVESAAAPQPTASIATTKVEPQTDIVEVGYEVGMRAPEFGMSLLDGSKVTSSSLANEGKPVFLYFHATF